MKRSIWILTAFFITSLLSSCGNPPLMSPFNKRNLASKGGPNQAFSVSAKCSKFEAPLYWNYLVGTLTIPPTSPGSVQMDVTHIDSGWLTTPSNTVKFSKVTARPSSGDPGAPFRIVVDGVNLSQDAMMQQWQPFFSTGNLPAFVINHILSTYHRAPNKLIFEGMSSTDALKITYTVPIMGTLETLVLRPPFEANPDLYKTNHSEDLSDAHPLARFAGQPNAFKAYLGDVCAL